MEIREMQAVKKIQQTEHGSNRAIVTKQRESPLRRARWKRINLPGVLFILGLLAVWEFADRQGLIDLIFLPPPSEIGKAAVHQVLSGQFLANLKHTLGVLLTGWVIAGTLGILIGTVFGISRTVWTFGMATIELFRALPSIVLLPIAVLIFGFSVSMELVLVVFSAQWPVMVATIDGVKQVPQGLLDTARTLRLSNDQTIRKIIIPNAPQQILIGLRLALSLSLILTVAAEMLGNPRGMGNALVKAQESFRAADMFAYFLAIGLLGILLNSVFMAVTKRFSHSQREAER